MQLSLSLSNAILLITSLSLWFLWIFFTNDSEILEGIFMFCKMKMICSKLAVDLVHRFVAWRNQPLFMHFVEEETGKIYTQHCCNQSNSRFWLSEHLYDGGNITKSYNWKGYGLKEEVHKVVVFTMPKIMTEQRKRNASCKSQLQYIKSVHVQKVRKKEHTHQPKKGENYYEKYTSK